MQIALFRRPACWTARFYGSTRLPSNIEFPLPYTPEASADFVYAEVGRRYPEARLFHVIDTSCEGCGQ